MQMRILNNITSIHDSSETVSDLATLKLHPHVIRRIFVHDFDQETKRQFCDKNHICSQTPKKLKINPSAGKVMATVF